MNESFANGIIRGRCYNKKFITSKNGTPMLFFTVTTYREVKGSDDVPQFHSVVAYSKTAELLNDYIIDPTEHEKARDVLLEVSIDPYQKEGITKTQLVVKRAHLLSPRNVA